MKSNKKNLKFDFIDLFAGIGGFHQALKAQGGNCIGASEIDQKCIELYEKNFPNTKILEDINKYIDFQNYKLPKFDVLAAGFPCQPFSKAGNQQGFEDEYRGKLFFTIIEILKKHTECKFIILENVKNLAVKKENWDKIKSQLKKLNFYITESPLILSPTQFKIPQSRERVYILGIRKDIIDKNKFTNGDIRIEDLGNFSNLPKSNCKLGDAKKILKDKYPPDCLLSKKQNEILKNWLLFKKGTNYDVPNVPLWVDYFGYKLSNEEYKNQLFDRFIKNSVGKNIRVKVTIEKLPEWKQRFATKNRIFYLKHKNFIDRWIEKTKILDEIKVYKKFEWNVGTDIKDYENTIIQFRQSGIRVKKDDYFPALVAINNTPIVYDKKNNILRKISPREAANLQSFKKNYSLPNEFTNSIYKQLGNAVNVDLVEKLFSNLLNLAIQNWKEKK